MTEPTDEQVDRFLAQTDPTKWASLSPLEKKIGRDQFRAAVQREAERIAAEYVAEVDEPLMASDRGFFRGEPISSSYGGTIQAVESSAAEYPHIWVFTICPANLNDPDGPTIEASAHLRIEDAEKLARQLNQLVRDHYQMENGERL